MNERLDRIAASLPGSRDPADWLELVRELQRLDVLNLELTRYYIRRGNHIIKDVVYWHPDIRIWSEKNIQRSSLYGMRKEQLLEEADYLKSVGVDARELIVETVTTSCQEIERVRVNILSVFLHWEE